MESSRPPPNTYRRLQTKVHRCHRCKRVMYPGPVGSPSNHPRGVCSDGVWQAARVEKTNDKGKAVPALEDPPPFPQPEKLFTADKDGHYFHAERLFKLLHDLYLRIIADVAGSGLSAMYDIAFAKLLQSRMKLIDATSTSPMVVLFRPYHNVKSIGIRDEQMYSYCGEEWIRLDDLSETGNTGYAMFAAPQTAPGSSQLVSSQLAQPVSSHAGPSHPAALHPGSPRSPHTPHSLGTSRAGSLQPGSSRAGSSQLHTLSS